MKDEEELLKKLEYTKLHRANDYLWLSEEEIDLLIFILKDR